MLHVNYILNLGNAHLALKIIYLHIVLYVNDISLTLLHSMYRYAKFTACSLQLEVFSKFLDVPRKQRLVFPHCLPKQIAPRVYRNLHRYIVVIWE